MKRTSLIVAATGAAAVLAVTGTALGVTTAGREGGRPALAAATVAPTPDGQPSVAPSATGPTPGGPASTAPVPTGTAPATGDPAAGDQVSPQRAGEIALARAGGGQITEIEAEREHDRDVWSVEILNGTTEHEIEVDRHDGSIVKAEQEPADDDRDDTDDDDDDRDDD
ncbi:PepSY domain-containing protein [Micromonospora sp. CPCC 206060]|uniref:PepSY domain-containing protein n=1 Tax=Micromonospora sp. CPCC 206060 TaxID=3122406 RepID=UPI002FF13822